MTDKSLRDPLILIVEDDALSVEHACSCLAEMFHNLETAASLKEATDRVAREPVPDCILLDVFLPNSEGINTLVKMHAAAMKIPIIVVSGYEFSDGEIKAAGGKGYLRKPVSAVEIIEEVSRVVGEYWSKGAAAPIRAETKDVKKELQESRQRLDALEESLQRKERGQ